MHIRKPISLRGMAGVLFLGLLLPVLSHAADLTDRLSVRGFGTLDITHSDSDNAVIPAETATPPIINKGQTSYDSSVLGMQADYQLTGALDFTLQAVSTAQINGSYSPRIDWAYLNYDLGNDYRLRAGKMMVPLLQGTELRYVGFSRLWVRPMVPPSGADGFDSYQGLDLTKSIASGDYNVRFEAVYGQAKHVQINVHNNDIKLLSTRVEKNGSWVNFAVFQSAYQFNAPNNPNQLLLDGCRALEASAETEILLGDAVINGGYAHSNAGALPGEMLGYLSFGYHFGRLTPYLYQSQHRLALDASQLPAPPPPPPPGGGGPPPPPPRLNGTNKTDSLALGFRYDLGATYALKGQLEHWSNFNNSDSTKGSVSLSGNLFTLVLDVAF